MPVTVKITFKNNTWETSTGTWAENLSTWQTAGIQVINLGNVDSFAVTDGVAKHSSCINKEVVALNDKRPFFAVNRDVLEFIGVMETYWDNIFYTLHLLENIGVAELAQKATKVPLSESVKFATDSLSNMFEKRNLEAICAAEQYSRNASFTRSFAEQAILTEQLIKQVAQNKIESLQFAEHISKAFTQVAPEDIALTDSYTKKFIASKLFQEEVDLAEFDSRHIGLNSHESMALYDALIRAANGVLSNIGISDTAMSLDDFKRAIGQPSGYSSFMDFKVGEYEYQEALVRLIMGTSVMQSQPTASSVVLHVDIPDTDDRGIVEITDTTGPTKVYFNKYYYNPPEVNVTVKGGNAANGFLVPSIVSTDKIDDAGRYFEVELWNENWTQRKSGIISWFSKGY